MTYGPLDGKMVEFKYDARNRLIEAGTTTYQYDAENNRIGKTENGQTTTYVVDTTSGALSKVLVEKEGNIVRQYIYATGLIMHVEGGEYATYHYDNRGSTVAITNGQGTVTIPLPMVHTANNAAEQERLEHHFSTTVDTA